MDEEDESRSLLRSTNEAAWNNDPVELKSLDSSLKKNTAFVKKLKTSINKESAAQILKEIKTLSLTKYQSELLLGTQEGLLKCTKSSDINAAIEIVSALHQRFSSGFTPLLLSWFLINLESPKAPLNEKEETDRIGKIKILLRLFIEFVDVRVFNSDIKKLEDVPNYVLTRTKNGDSLSGAVLKETLGYKVSGGSTLTVATTFIKRFPKLIDSNKEINHILKSFSEAIISRTESMFKKLKDLSKQKFKAQIRTGRVVEEYENEFNELNSLFEKFYNASLLLGEFFNIKVFEFTPSDLDCKPNDSDQIIISKDTSVWSNDEERRFYEVIPEIPIELIESNQKESKPEEMNDFLIKLETCTTIKEIDETVLEFWTLKLNNKASRNRLIKHMTLSKDVSKAKTYARVLKINEKYLTDVINEVIAYLDQGFRSQIYHNGINFRNIVFFCELIKFKLIPEHVTFHKIRSLILNLTTPNNIEILSIFFEFSGKFLLHEHEKLMEEMLNLLEIKRKNDKLTINNKMAISNLFLLLKPPSIKSLQVKKELKPEQQFIKILIRKELDMASSADIRKILVKVNLNDKDMFDTMLSLFSKPEKINYENIIALTDILKNLDVSFKTIVIDKLLERITNGMEINDYRYNRVRMVQCKYISEIYEAKIVGVSEIHDLLYQILTFGHPNNNPTWNRISELDPPDNYFRIQMACLILESIALRRLSFRKKFNILLKFFDYYIWLKDQPIPKDFEFKISKVFEKYEFKRSHDLKEAAEKLAEIARSGNNKSKTTEEDEEDDEEDDDEEEEEDEESLSKSVNNLNIDDDEIDKNDEVVAKLSYEAYERKLQEEEERKLEEKLEKEFKRMVSESMNSQKNNTAKPTIIDLPTNLQDEPKPKPKILGRGTIPFTLVTKKGKMVATKSLELPSNVKFANTIVEEGKKQKQEKEQIKRFILNSKFED